MSARMKSNHAHHSKLKVVVERESGAMHYEDADGKQLTTEDYRSLRPVEVNGEKTLHAEVLLRDLRIA